MGGGLKTLCKKMFKNFDHFSQKAIHFWWTSLYTELLLRGTLGCNPCPSNAARPLSYKTKTTYFFKTKTTFSRPSTLF